MGTKTRNDSIIGVIFLFLFLYKCTCSQKMEVLNGVNNTTIPTPINRTTVKTHNLRHAINSNYDYCNSSAEGETKCGTIEYLGCTGSKKFYHESAIKMSWFEAWEYCRSVGLHLAAIDSSYEQIFIELFLPALEVQNTETYWTSGTDLGKQGQFTWMATGRSFSFMKWRPGEPNNRFGSEDCIELLIRPGVTGYFWNDRNCHARGYALCQHDLRYPDKLFETEPSHHHHKL